MKVSVICPIYNGEKYIDKLHDNLLSQEKLKDEVVEIKYVITKSKDKSEEKIKEKGASYTVIDKHEFSHSLTREREAYESNGDVIVFISQDIKPKNNRWLKELIKPIVNNDAEATFSRQICENNSIEKYIREKNYPEVSRCVSENDISKLGLLTFFYSDAASAINSSVYKELNGYDGKNLIINEDMYLAHKLITNGYKIKYCSKSEVYHSHIFTLKQLFNRYFDTGVFMKENSHFMKYNGNESGLKLASYVLKRSLKEKNIKVTLNILPNFGARFIGSNLGKRYEGLNQKRLKQYSLNKGYWTEL